MAENIQEKRDFGSFHVSNIQELLSIPENEYFQPKIPFETLKFNSKPNFGSREMKLEYFYLDPNWTFINHGAFGAALRPGLETAQKWQIYIEKQPLKAIDRELFPHLVSVTRRLAKFVNASPSDIALTINVTTALNCVLKSIDFAKYDTIFYLSTAYGSVKKIVKEIATQKSLNIYENVIEFPIKSANQILEIVTKGLDACKTPKLAIFDHIASNYGVVFPVKELAAICKSRNILVLIDGAHALGALPLDLSEISADFYTSNAHKWFCSPKGAAFLHVRAELKEQIKPLVISHGAGSGFNSELMWSGLRDYSSILALNCVMGFWEYFGPDSIREYIYTTVLNAAEMLMNKWGTELLCDKSLFKQMSLIQLPIKIQNKDQKQLNYEDAEKIQNWLHFERKIEVPIKLIQNKLYVRISGHIYNNIDDYIYLANSIQIYISKH